MAPTFLQVSLGLSAVFAAISTVLAESHTVMFENKCGHGTPTLVVGGKVVSTGDPYTVNGILNGIAYLQTGECQFNGENCSIVETNLADPECAGCGSSTDISLISPHAYNVETSFTYYNGCDGQGKDCASANCNTAFFTPEDWQVQVQCEANDVNLLITFCGDATKSGAPQPSPAPAKPSTSQASPAKPSTSEPPAKPSTSEPTKPSTSDTPAKPSTSSEVPSKPTSAETSSTEAIPATSKPSESAPTAVPSLSTAASSLSTETPASTTAPESTVLNVGAAEPSATSSSSAPTATTTVVPPSKSGRCAIKKRSSSLVKKAEAVAAVAKARSHGQHRRRAH